MATGKAKKKDKLRHAEHYDFQEIQDKLYADSNKVKYSSIWLKSLHCPKISGWHTEISRRTTGA